MVDPGATVPFYGAETIFARATGAHPIVRSLEQAKVGVIFALARSVGAGRAPEGTDGAGAAADDGRRLGRDRSRQSARGRQGRQGPDRSGAARGSGRRARRSEAAAGGPRGRGADAAGAEAAPRTAPSAAAWRLVVVGDSDFATNSLLTLSGNPTLLANAFNWLLDRQKLLGIGPKKPEQVRMTLTPGQLSGITWLVLAGLPALAIAAGVAVYFRRRR